MRQVLTVDLKDDPDVIAAYVEHHQRVWPEVLASFRAAGIEEMEIVRLGRRLVMIVDTRGDFRDAFASHLASNPQVARWEALMQSMQQPVPGRPDGEWWALMQPVFRFSATEPCPI